MAKKTPTKGKQRTPPRTVAISARLDPQMKFLLEIAAKMERRSMSNFLERAVEDRARTITVDEGNLEVDDDLEDPPRDAYELARQLWSVNPLETFVRLAMRYPDLLDYDERARWHVILHTPEFWQLPPLVEPDIRIHHCNLCYLQDQVPEIQDLIDQAANNVPPRGLTKEEIEQLGWEPDDSRYNPFEDS